MLIVLVTPLHLYMQIGVAFHIFKNLIAIFEKQKQNVIFGLLFYWVQQTD